MRIDPALYEILRQSVAAPPSRADDLEPEAGEAVDDEGPGEDRASL